MNILHVCADPKPIDESVTKQLAASFFSKLIEMNPEAEITNVDLYEEPPPYLSYEAYRGYWYPASIQGYSATDKEIAAMKYGLEQGELVARSDVLVITAPMWTYSIPAILKSWMDHIFSPGRLLTLENGEFVPHHRVQKAILLVSSGDSFMEDDERDALTPLIESALRTIGITDISKAWADGQHAFKFEDSETRKSLAMEAAEELAEEVAELSEHTA